MEKANLIPAMSEVSMIANLQVSPDKETCEKITGLIDALEDLDDVQNVYSNADIS